MFAREGYPYILGTTAIAVALFGAALRLRSWPFWLGALLVTIVALYVAWYVRDPQQVNRDPVHTVVSLLAHGAGARTIANQPIT